MMRPLPRLAALTGPSTILSRHPRFPLLQRAFSISAQTCVDASHLPRVAQRSTWIQLIPRAFRRRDSPLEAAERKKAKAQRSKEWNPATVFIVLGLLVGSNAINIIKLRKEMLNFSRQTDARLDLLREVVERVRRGEDVNVEKELGTGDPMQEKEWEQMMKEIEETNMLAEGKKRREAKRAQQAEKKAAAMQRVDDASPVDGNTKADDPPRSEPRFM